MDDFVRRTKLMELSNGTLNELPQNIIVPNYDRFIIYGDASFTFLGRYGWLPPGPDPKSCSTSLRKFLKI